MKRRLSLCLLFHVQFAFLACAQQASEQDSSSDTKVACVGDSITFGAAIADRKTHNYPTQLDRLLGKGYSVRNFGVNSATLLKEGNRPYWKTKQFGEATEWQPDIVVIKLGTNDTKPGNWKHKDKVAGDLKSMITAFRSLPSKPEVFVCLPVPAFPDRWGIRDSVIKGELIPILRSVAEEQKCPVIDLYAALEGKAELFPDRIHPNKDGAKLIAETVHGALEKEAAHPN